jgi:hypothetical protein
MDFGLGGVFLTMGTLFKGAVFFSGLGFGVMGAGLGIAVTGAGRFLTVWR